VMACARMGIGGAVSHQLVPFRDTRTVVPQERLTRHRTFFTPRPAAGTSG
jgi:hypothetical protein